MKRLKSSDDLDSFEDKGISKDWGRRDDDSSLNRSMSHRSFYYKSENGRKGLSSSSSRYDRLEDDRESLRSNRKRSDYEVDPYERRKNYDRYRDSSDRGVLSSSPRSAYSGDRIHRSESFCGTRREFPKGIRSERDRSRREGSVSSWRKFGGKDVDEGNKSGGDSRGNKVASDDIGKVRSPQGPRDAKSPPWSKDSGSEQSKSTEVKKNEDLLVDSGNTSEMEEGELIPDPEPAPTLEPVSEDQASISLNPDQKELDNSEHLADNKLLEVGANEDHVEHYKGNANEDKTEVGASGAVQVEVKEDDDESFCQDNLIQLKSAGEGLINRTMTDDKYDNDEEVSKEYCNNDETKKHTFDEKSLPSEEGNKEDKGIDLEVKVEDVGGTETINEVTEQNRAHKDVVSIVTEEITQNFKDKGKSVAISPSNDTDTAENVARTKRESWSLSCQDTDFEGPSTRGLDLFSNGPVKKPGKADSPCHNNPMDEKLGFGSLELSLSLPNELLPIGGSHSTAQAPGSPGRTTSVQSFPSSFYTHSDGFTASMSFTGSQHFSHNPSCSLTQNSFDNHEQSVHSRPIFQGLDHVSPVAWLGHSSNEQKKKEVPTYQKMLSNGNGVCSQSQTSEGNVNAQAMQVQHLKVAEGSSRTPVVLDKQLSMQKHLSGMSMKHQNDIRSPSQSVGSHDTGSEYNRDKKRMMREKNGGGLCRSAVQDRKEQFLMGGADTVESIITLMVSEPLPAMARRFNEMTEQTLARLKEAFGDIILNPGKRWQLCAFQKALQSRSEINLEMLLRSHRAQLEILVAVKTGLQEFLLQNYDASSSDLAEIFLNIRCRNLTCRSLLPVDECDCKVCAPKNGFCSSCMCLVCSKFDMASNTCSWVGCDVCLHWCHADCGLRESYIRNGRSASGAPGTTEMQFHCVACNHPSEMFGFVKEVFQNFAKDWTAETLSKELEHVRRIFCLSEDGRGRQLHDIAVQMLSRLTKKSDLKEIQNHVMGFLNVTESDSFKLPNPQFVPGREITNKNQGQEGDGVSVPSHDITWRKSAFLEKPPHLEKAAGLLSGFDYNENDRNTGNSDLARNAQKEPMFDELETVVRIKKAEAKMFQSRADDARREAEGLKRIAVAKNEKIEEEYASRIAKLRLSEAEEMRKQKFEELQALERAHREYFHMKMRMESDIKDLLMKMEATKRNLSM